MEQRQRRFVITKKIAKHGSQAVIVIPRILEQQLKPGTVAQFTIDILEQETQNG
jgi:antitoxin component of MazEF toxin-antitoxin module